MTPFQSLLLYIVLVIILIIVFIRLRIRSISAIMLALIIGCATIAVLCPPSQIDNASGDPSGSISAFYLLIMFGTPLLVSIYTVVLCWKDRI